MPISDWITTIDIADVFCEELSAASGELTDRYDDGDRLFLRGILPRQAEVQRRDLIDQGVALMAIRGEVRVHPYTFRQVCSNGAILAHALQTRRIEVPEIAPAWEIEDDIREAVRACSREDAFIAGMEEMRDALHSDVDSALNTITFFLSHNMRRFGAQTLGSILDQLLRGQDHSRFGLMNAVTAVARDTRNPELRWRLEELGGAIGAGLKSPPRLPRKSARQIPQWNPAADRDPVAV